MRFLRRIRRGLTSGAGHAALRAAPWTPRGCVAALRRRVAAIGPHAPLLARQVADNMRAAGVYSVAAHREYFTRCAEHLAAALHIFRAAGRGAVMPPDLAALVNESIELDASIRLLQAAASEGRGAVVMPAHGVNYLLALARVNQVVPITVYLRHSKDPRRAAAKQRWCRTCGLRYIAEPAGLIDPTSRAARMAEALRDGRVLVITPDLPQKRGDGVAVNFLDRRIELPPGGPALAILAEAPLLAVTHRAAGAAHALVFHGPYADAAPPSGRGWRQAAIQRRLQWFADLFAAFLRADPALWFLWGDSRWTRVFRADPRYTGAAGPGDAPPDAAGRANDAKGHT